MQKRGKDLSFLHRGPFGCFCCILIKNNKRHAFAATGLLPCPMSIMFICYFFDKEGENICRSAFHQFQTWVMLLIAYDLARNNSSKAVLSK